MGLVAAAPRVFGAVVSKSERRLGCYLGGFGVIKIEKTYEVFNRGEGALRAPSPLVVVGGGE